MSGQAARKRGPFLVFLTALAVLLAGLYAGGRAKRARRSLDASRISAHHAGASGGHPVLFIGLDGADWNLLDDYLAGGVMPNLASLAREGTSGILTTLHPPLSPLVWTSMMTGVGPLDHGILDFTRFNPKTGAREPITSEERLVPAIWNMVTASGGRVAVLGLWATYPAERVNGLMVSDRLFSYHHDEKEPPAGVVYPPDFEASARRAVTRAEGDTGPAALRVYLPWLDEKEYSVLAARPDPFAHPATALRRILIETRVYHDLAKTWMEQNEPDLAIVYFQGTDAIGHLFAPYAPPRQDGIRVEDYDRYSDVPRRYFAEIDRLLGEYRDIARARGAVLMIASDHGFRWRDGRPKEISGRLAATAGKWHRDEGISVLWGPGIGAASPAGDGRAAATGRATSGDVTRVCATLLALLGLPAAEGIAGPPLGRSAPPDTAAVDYRASYRRPAHAEITAADPAADAEAVAKLRALGYIGGAEPTRVPAAGGPPVEAASGSTRTPGSYNNEGLILREQGKTEEAIAAFERALAMDPRLASALWNLSDLLFDSGRDAGRSDDLLVRSVEAGFPDGPRNVIARAIACRRAGDIDRSLRLLAAAAAARPLESELWLFHGRYRVETGDCRGAMDDFARAERLDPKNALVPASSGLARLCLGDRAGARREFLRSLAIDPDQPELRRSLEQGP